MMTGLLRKREGAFAETAIDGEVVVMDLSKGDFFSLTGTAAAVWRRIDGTRDRATLVSEIAAEYDAQSEAVGRDIAAFLDQLDGAGLIDGA